MRLWPAFALLTLGACADYPRDIEGTYDRVRQSGVLRVGYAAIQPEDRSRAEAFVAKAAAAVGAREQISAGSVEHQLAQLEDGKLDLVLGDFADDTPWLQDVAVIEPLSERREGKRTIGLAPVAANGENRWIMLLERQVRDMRESSPR